MSDTGTPTLGQVFYPEGSKDPDPATPPVVDPTATAPVDPTTSPVGDPPADPPSAGDPPSDGLLTKDPDAKAEGDPKPETPPTFTAESYADLALPEGLVVDQPMFDEFKALALDKQISPEVASSLLDLQKKFQESQQTLMSKAIAEQDQKWSAELNTIPELSGDNRAKAQEVIGRAIAEFGSPEVRQVLSSYGLANNPALARFIYSMAEALVEGGADPSGGVAYNGRNPNKGKTLGQIFYPDDDQTQ